MPRREKANSGRPRSFPTSALTRITSVMAATATVNRTASSTVDPFLCHDKLLLPAVCGILMSLTIP